MAKSKPKPQPPQPQPPQPQPPVEIGALEIEGARRDLWKLLARVFKGGAFIRSHCRRAITVAFWAAAPHLPEAQADEMAEWGDRALRKPGAEDIETLKAICRKYGWTFRGDADDDKIKKHQK